MPDAAPFEPGFVVLHGNRIEDLAAVALDWLARHPLGPLDEETLLVPSSGMAEWLKGTMATRQGIAAGFRLELPAQFVWRAWRAVLGPEAVPMSSPLDKAPLTWWLMRLLPRLAAQPVFAPLAGFLAADDAPMRRLELARRLADLFDQYQVYRPDWLDDWAAGRDRLARAPGAAEAVPLPPGQRWQAALWRALLAELGERGGARAGVLSRPALHQRFLAELAARPRGSPPPGLPPRLLLFGTTHLPHTTLEALAALARHVPVLLAVPDPCAHPWADETTDETLVPPLLRAWGRQCRDFVRQLQAHDDGRARAEQLGLVRTALFDEGPGATMLQHLQARIRDRSPADEPAIAVAADDRSLQFHTAHGPLREVELLHDQLLEAFATTDLEPRDVVVMVPDIERFAPAVAAVFGRFEPGHPRHVPWGLADRPERGRHALLRALELLLEVRERRFTHQELRDLLGTASVAARLPLGEAEAAQVAAWMAEAGVRWGLHEAQRAALGLEAAGAVGTWRFALDRLLMGYATGAPSTAAEPPGGIEPWPGVAGLAAASAGVLDDWLAALDAWWAEAAEPRPPQVWLPRLRRLLTSMFSATDDRERTLLALLDDALQGWVASCDAVGFDEPLPLTLVREAWLSGLDEAGGGRFRAGGVTFCTLLPLRAIPFRWVCLLGLNDGEYPRPASRSDFDLMADPALARPGDRSRRDDDRQLMLDALLAARERLHVSWSAHSARDGQPQPPSVLVAQLRDHVRALWDADGRARLLERLTVAHPLQPFSRRYLEAGGDERLFTRADEWRALHEPPPAAPPPAAAAPRTLPTVVTLAQLAEFVRNPVRAFFRERLRTDLRLRQDEIDDDEPFTEHGLDGWQWRDELLRTLRPWMQAAGARATSDEQAARLRRAVARLRREGRLPWGGPGEAVAESLVAGLLPVLRAWGQHEAESHAPEDARLEAFEHEGLRLDTGPLPWRLGSDGGAEWLDVAASRLTADKARRVARADKLIAAWLHLLALGAAGRPARLVMLGADVIATAPPIERELARRTLATLLHAWRDGVSGDAPWPTVLATGLACLAGEDMDAAFGSSGHRRGDDADPHVARLFPRLEVLTSQAGFDTATRTLYEPLAAWLETVALDPLPDAVPVDDDAGAADD